MPHRSLLMFSAALSLAVCAAPAARAQEKTAAPVAQAQGEAAAQPAPAPALKHHCTGSTYDQFDFWVGDWKVTDTKTGELIAFDRVQRINDGCTIWQDFHQLNDESRRRNSLARMHSMSVSGFDGKHWRQAYFDNMGQFITLAGGPDDKHPMVLAGDLQPASTDEVRVHWEVRPDGTVRNFGFRRPAGGEWKPFFDVTYHPNLPGK